MSERVDEASSRGVNVFTYGSLMYLPVWSQIVSGSYVSVDGYVTGYQRFAVLNEDYPGVAKAGADSMVNGRLYLDVNADDLKRLDDFEGECYSRGICVVTSPKGDFEAQLYVIKPEHVGILSPELWSQLQFEQQGLQRFLNQYAGFERM